MNTTAADNTEIMEIMQTLMNEGTKGFPSVVAKMYNLAMQFERELHLGAGRYERTEERSGYANGYKPTTLDTAAGRLRLQIPQVRDCDRPFYPKSLERGLRSDRALRMAVAEMYVKGIVVSGTSPRVWGKQGRLGPQLRLPRNIPTCVGKTILMVMIPC